MMNRNELEDSLKRGADKAKRVADETGQDIDDMLFTAFAPPGEEMVKSIQDVNIAGEPVPFICSPCSIPTPIPNCHRMECDGCRQPVWMSPATKLTFDKIKKKVIVCLECMLKQMPNGQELLEKLHNESA